MNKPILVVFLLIITFFGFYLIFRAQNSLFGLRKLEVERIADKRSRAIEKAVEEGVYKCCIHPPCTMCYSVANRWNNYQAGTCACDELITEEKEPCPQCKSKGEFCETNAIGECNEGGDI